jgi:hypothetical protein
MANANLPDNIATGPPKDWYNRERVKHLPVIVKKPCGPADRAEARAYPAFAGEPSNTTIV